MSDQTSPSEVPSEQPKATLLDRLDPVITRALQQCVDSGSYVTLVARMLDDHVVLDVTSVAFPSDKLPALLKLASADLCDRLNRFVTENVGKPVVSGAGGLRLGDVMQPPKE